MTTNDETLTDDSEVALADYVAALVAIGAYGTAADNLCAGCRLPAMSPESRLMLAAALARRDLTLTPHGRDAWYVTRFEDDWGDFETTTQAAPVTTEEAFGRIR